MTPGDLEILSGLEASATPAPWFVRRMNDDVCMSGVGVSTNPGPDEPMIDYTAWTGKDIVAACLVQEPPYVVPADNRFDENAALIVTMRNALPELLRLSSLGMAVETRPKATSRQDDG